MTNTEQRETAALIRQFCIFCLERKGKCYAGWNGAKVFRWLAWHYLNGTLFLVWEGSTLKGLGVAFRVRHSELLQKVQADAYIFDWKALNEQGDATFICDVFGSRKYCKGLWDKVCTKWPEANAQPVYTYRKGKLHELDLGRFCV